MHINFHKRGGLIPENETLGSKLSAVHSQELKAVWLHFTIIYDQPTPPFLLLYLLLN